MSNARPISVDEKSQDSKEETIRLEKFLKGLSFLQQYPPIEIYRLVVDGVLVKHEKGWEKYHGRGPKDIQAVLKALIVAIRYFLYTDKLTIDLILNIHEAAAISLKDYVGEFRDNRPCVTFGEMMKGSGENMYDIPGVEKLLDMIEDEKSIYPEDEGTGLGKYTPHGSVSQVIYWNTIQENRRRYGAKNNKELAEEFFSSLRYWS